MSSKQLKIDSFTQQYFLSPYLAPTVCQTTKQGKDPCSCETYGQT